MFSIRENFHMQVQCKCGLNFAWNLYKKRPKEIWSAWKENVRANLLFRSISIAMYEAGSAAPKPADQE